MGHTVYVEFTKPDKWFKPFAWAIQWFEGTDYSHVRLRWHSTSGEELIYEASGSSVKLIGRYAKHLHPAVSIKSYKFDLTPEQYRKMIGLFRFAGVEYGIWQVLGIAVARWLCLKKNPFSLGRYAQVCSELVAVFLEDVLNLDVGEDLDLVGPRQLQEFLERLTTP
jgi:hypothetical protein